ncbi:hypothetical protein ACRARH_24110 [Phytobacter ursingii]
MYQSAKDHQFCICLIDITTGILFLLASAFTSITPVYADSLVCTSTMGIDIGGNYAVASGNVNITAPANPTADIYSIIDTKMGTGGIEVTCSGDYRIALTVINFPANPLYGDNAADNIFSPTSNPNIATVINGTVNGNFKNAPKWPDAVDLSTTVSANTSRAFKPAFGVRIRLNYPDAIPRIAAGLFGGFSGPTLALFVKPASAGDTIATCPTGSQRIHGDNRTCLLVSRQITSPGTHLYAGTCEMLVPNKVVYMGQHAGTSGQYSRWVDASFDIKCPKAWGSSTKRAGSSNPGDDSDAVGSARQNKPITIAILPYTPVLDLANGIIALETGGASGYGIQLSWGPPSAQGKLATAPVNLSGWSYLNAANSNYPTSDYAIGDTAIPHGVDGKVYLSARYIRTTGPFQPGIANSRVEVIISYN